MAKIICIDAGHGGSDSGACKGSRTEKADVLKMAKAVETLLKAQGVSVVLTRSTDKDITINERCNIANKANADYFLSIHRNSGGGTGNEIWVYSAASSSTSSKANTILKNVCSVYGKNRGVKKGAVSYTDYGVNKYSNMPSALLELGFIDSTADNTAYDSKFNENALAIAKGLCAAVGVTYKTVAAPKPEAIKVGDKVKITSGAKYGGLSVARGKSVPSQFCNKSYTVSKLATHNKVKEALIRELFSWVAVSYLTK